MKVWKGQKPQHTIAIKIDGIQAVLKNNQVVSRSNTPLYNIDPCLLEEGKRYEVYLGSFKLTNSVLRTHVHERKVQQHELYEIHPNTDERLLLHPLDSDLKELFNHVLALGFEGLVIDQTYKIKPKRTYDVPVIGIIPGKGKHTGRMGALVTPMGKVGIGFTDAERELNWQLGILIEVECMELTADGKFRLPRFIRERWDKK
jgi:hypothetical protein